MSYTTDVFLNYAQNNTWARLAPSSIHGIGVFAIKDIPINCDLFPDCLNLFDSIPLVDLRNLPIEVLKMSKDFFYHNNGRIWIPNLTLNQINISFFLNSSQTPNCEHDDDGRITTNREVKQGEELTHNYEIGN